MQTAIHPIDVAIIVVYLTGLACVGLYFSRRQTNLDEFFLARQSMAWLPVGLSLMAALDSAIDYLMQPSATIRYGLILLIGTSSWLLLYPWVALVTLPFYRRLNYFTAYEYLEARFDVRVRALAAGDLHRLAAGMDGDGHLRAVPGDQHRDGRSIAVEHWSCSCSVSSSRSTRRSAALQAVIWNDVMQFCVRFGGLAAVVVDCRRRRSTGGLGRDLGDGERAGKTTTIAPVDFGTGGVRRSRWRLSSISRSNVVSIMFAHGRRPHGVVHVATRSWCSGCRPPSR